LPERKSLQIELKADKPGSVRAIFSTFNVIDKDGDVTIPGAFTQGEAVRLLPAHNWAHYAIGKGAISADDSQAFFDGMFNLNTTAGKDWYESVKDIGDLQEWSYGFDVIDAEPGVVNGVNVRVLKKLRVHEVSPVTLGAGIGTGTLAIKASTFEEALDHADELVSGLSAYAERVRDRSDFRAKEGRSLSEANRLRIGKHIESLRGIVGDLEDLASPPEPKAVSEIGQALHMASERARFQRESARLQRIGVIDRPVPLL
jgi:HK97 family phage prohead protease